MITKKSAAIGQLEGAIYLWFDYGDPAAILTLAAAANDCYHAMGKAKGRPAVIQAHIETLSRKEQDAARAAQNFAKHGMRDLNKRIPYLPGHGELLIFDSVLCHEHVFETLTPLMSAFEIQWVILNPRYLRSNRFAPIGHVTGEIVEVYQRLKLDRRSFLKVILPGLSETTD